MVASRAVSERDTNSAGHFSAAIFNQCQESSFAVFDGDGETAVVIVGNVPLVAVQIGVE